MVNILSAPNVKEIPVSEQEDMKVICVGSDTEYGETIVDVKIFDPALHKDIYLLGEKSHNFSQYVITVRSTSGQEKEIGVFAKQLKNEDAAEKEYQAYTICRRLNIPSFKLIKKFSLNGRPYIMTETENYLIPYSKLRIKNLDQYSNMLNNGLHLIDLLGEAGISHCDTLSRNFGVLSTNPDQTLVYDFEQSKIYPAEVEKLINDRDKGIFKESLFFQCVEQNPGMFELHQQAMQLNSSL